MSKSKSSNVVTITVSIEDFKGACEGVVKSGNDALTALITASAYIAQATNKKEQDASKKAVALAWVDYQKKVEGKTIKLESAQKWVTRRVKQLAPKGFKWLVSKTATATRLRKARAGGKATTTPATTTPAKAPAKPTSIEQFRNAIIAKEVAIQDEYRNYIPAGKIKEYDQAFAAFIQTLNVILK